MNIPQLVYLFSYEMTFRLFIVLCYMNEVIMNKAAINIHVQVFCRHMLLFLFGMGLVGRCMFNYNNYHFPKMIVSFYTLISIYESSSYTTFLPIFSVMSFKFCPL